MNISYSSLDTFRTCPQKYKFQVLDKISIPKSAVSVFGTLIHSALKFAHQGSFLPPSKEEVLDYFSQHWNSEIFAGNQIEERMAFTKGVKIIQDYYQKNDLSSVKVVALEEKFHLPLSDKKEQHLISGIFDRIDKIEGEHEFEIIDYKTSNKLPSQENIDNNWQLLIYLLAFLKRYPQYEQKPEKIKLSLYFLNHNIKLFTFKNKRQLEEGKEEILEEIRKINSSDFSPTVSPLCDWCGYQKICPMWRHKFEKEEKKEDYNEKELIEEFIQLRKEAKKIKDQLGEKQAQILELMRQNSVERLFGEKEIIARVSKKTYQYDEKKLRAILEEVGLWENVLKINEVQLKKVLGTLPPKIQKMIEETKSVSKESFSLSVKSAKKQ